MAPAAQGLAVLFLAATAAAWAAAALARLDRRVAALEQRLEELTRRQPEERRPPLLPLGPAGAGSGSGSVRRLAGGSYDSMPGTPACDLHYRPLEGVVDRWMWARYAFCVGMQDGAAGVALAASPAWHGDEAETLAALGQDWSRDACDTALASAAFGEKMLGHQVPKEVSKGYTKMGEKKSGSLLKQRAKLLRVLFSAERFRPSSELLNTAFAKVGQWELDVPGRLMRVLAWGSMREHVMAFDKNECHRLRHGFAEFGDGPAGQVFRYLEQHPEALVEKNDDGQTLLMEMGREHGKGEANGTGCFDSLVALHEMYNVRIAVLSGEGETAAMVALLAHHEQRAKELERAHEDRDWERTRWLFQVEYPATVAAGTHLAVLAAALAFFACRPEVRAGRVGGVVDFGCKVLILIVINCLLRYGRHFGQLLREPWMLLSVSWVGGIEENYALQLTLFLLFLGMSFFDLSQAALPCGKVQATPHEVHVGSMYEDPSVPTFECVHTFLLSAIFVAFYVSSEARPVETSFFTRCLWAAALFVQVHLSTKGQGNEEVEDLFEHVQGLCRWAVRLDEGNLPLWQALFRQDRLRGKDGKAAPRQSKTEVLLRFTMSYLANGCFKMLTLYTLPIYLADSRHASEFVLHAFSVQFIYKLDDLASAKRYEVHPPDEEEESFSESGGSELSKDGFAPKALAADPELQRWLPPPAPSRSASSSRSLVCAGAENH